jgi:hypothetical protein
MVCTSATLDVFNPPVQRVRAVKKVKTQTKSRITGSAHRASYSVEDGQDDDDDGGGEEKPYSKRVTLANLFSIKRANLAAQATSTNTSTTYTFTNNATITQVQA